MKRIVVTVVACALLASSAPADAHVKKFDTASSAQFDAGGGTVSGTISSAKAKCLGARTVIATVEGIEYGRTTSEANGDWLIDEGPLDPNDDVEVTIKRLALRKGSGHRHLCKRSVTTAGFTG